MFTDYGRSDEGGHTLEQKEKPEGVGELVRPQEVGQDEGGEQDVGGAGDPVQRGVQQLSVVLVTGPGKLGAGVDQQRGGDISQVCHGDILINAAVIGGERCQHWLEIVGHRHRNPADHQTSVVQEQPDKLLH